MTKMLDIFEGSLSLYNFTYVRLDGSIKVNKSIRKLNLVFKYEY